MSRELAAAIRVLPDQAWQIECEDGDAIRHWAEVAYVPSDGIAAKDRLAPPRYLVSRVSKKQGRRFADGGEVKHFAIVTNRRDPEGGTGLDLIRWQRGKAGTVEHTHHVLTNELAAEALPSQRFGANAAWFRLNVMLHNLLSAFKRVALPPELPAARPKRLRFVLLNGVGKVIRHARETVLRRGGAPQARRCGQARPRHRSARRPHRLRSRRRLRPTALSAGTRHASIGADSFALHPRPTRHLPSTVPPARPCPPQTRARQPSRGFGSPAPGTGRSAPGYSEGEPSRLDRAPRRL